MRNIKDSRVNSKIKTMMILQMTHLLLMLTPVNFVYRCVGIHLQLTYDNQLRNNEYEKNKELKRYL